MLQKESKDHRFSLFLVENGLIVEGTCICGKNERQIGSPTGELKNKNYDCRRFTQHSL